MRSGPSLRWLLGGGLCLLLASGCGGDDDDDQKSSPEPATETPFPATPTPESATPTPESATPTPDPGDDDDTTQTPRPPTDRDKDGYPAEEDCNDRDEDIHPDADEVPYDGIDQDCDGKDLTDVDEDGFAGGKGPDCNDQDPRINPDADEVTDGVDNDCDGEIDNNVDTHDDDNDSFAESDGDCDDSDPQSYPGAEEIPYDGIDQDCEDGDLDDLDRDTYPGGPEGSDCDDDDAWSHPDAEETPYDGIDQDCDGSDLNDLDHDGEPSTKAGGSDCDDNNPGISGKTPEIPYDGIDQDCSGKDLTDVDGDNHDGEDAGGSDCDDNDANTWPGALEQDDDKDNDCDGKIDDNLANFDDDGDGFTDLEGDCNDEDEDINPNADDIAYDGIDQDCSGKDLTDVDGDSFSASFTPGGTDCDDDDPSIYPGADEIPYDEDQDCDGEDLVDVDGDNHASTAVAGGTDCNDIDPAINPDASEVCDSKDNNCDKVIDQDAVDRSTWYADSDKDTYGDPAKTSLACSAPKGYVEDHTDCDDASETTHPGAAEACDEADNDCDKEIDEGVQLTFYLDGDSDGYGTASSTKLACTTPTGYSASSEDCNDGDPQINPKAIELCNGYDDNCNDVVDEDTSVTFYQDADGDGKGNPEVTQVDCKPPEGFTLDNSDCDDTNAVVYPGAPKLCDGYDNDCDGEPDVTYVDTPVDPNTIYSYFKVDNKAGYGGNSSDYYLRLLTSADAGAVGGAWLKTQIDAKQWSASFFFTIGNGTGGEGMTFAFLDETAPRSTYPKGKLGIANLKGYAIEFDTNSNAEYGDTSENHVALIDTKNFVHIIKNDSLPFDLENTGEHLAEIDFNEGDIDLYLDGELTLSYTIENFALSKVSVGFTAASGTLTNNHFADDIYIGCK